MANILEVAVAFATVLGGYSFWIARFLDSRFDGLEKGLSAKIDGVEKALGIRIDGLETRIGNIERRLDGPSAA